MSSNIPISSPYTDSESATVRWAPHHRWLQRKTKKRLTVGAQEALELGHQADLVKLPQEPFVLYSRVKPHDEATGQGCQLEQHTLYGSVTHMFGTAAHPVDEYRHVAEF